MMDSVVGWGAVIVSLAVILGVLIVVAVGAHRHG